MVVEWGWRVELVTFLAFYSIFRMLPFGPRRWHGLRVPCVDWSKSIIYDVVERARS
jgi:hypothetical protein